MDHRVIQSHLLILTPRSPKPPAKANVNIICPMCSNEIINPVDKKKGQQFILCNGPCNKWLHQQCADLSKEASLKLLDPLQTLSTVPIVLLLAKNRR